MFFWVVQQIIISVVFIAVLHYIYIYFKDNLTIPKTKDLVKKPIQQYKEIYNTILKKETSDNNKNMRSELKNYIQNLHEKNKDNKQKPQQPAPSQGEFDVNNFEVNNSNLQGNGAGPDNYSNTSMFYSKF